MICQNCRTQNPEGFNFCMNCGETLRYSCPNCGQANEASVKFCTNCGYALGGAPQAAPVPVAPVIPRSRRRLKFALAGLFLVFLCSLLFWSTLLRLPAVPPASSSPAVVVKVIRTLHRLQTNLSPPQAVEAFADQLYGVSEPNFDDVEIDFQTDEDGNLQDVQLTLPPVCGPEIKLGEPKITREEKKIPVWDMLTAAAGNGKVTYDFENAGESMANNEYGYFARWYIYDSTLGKTTIKDFACSIENDGHLICSGPDLDSQQQSAMMNIVYEGGDCPMPIAGYAFGGSPGAQGPNPLSGSQLACDPAGSWEYADWTHYATGGTRFFIMNYVGGGETPPKKMYLLYTEARTDQETKSMTSLCRLPDIFCSGFDPDYWPYVRYVLYQYPLEMCPDPVASGEFGTVAPLELKTSCPEISLQPVSYKDLGSGDGPVVSDGEGPIPTRSIEVSFFFPETLAPTNPEAGFWFISGINETGDIPGENNASRAMQKCRWSPGGHSVACKYNYSFEDDRVFRVRFWDKENNDLTCDLPRGLLADVPGYSVYNHPEPPPPVDRCALFDGMDIEAIPGDWLPGAPLRINFKFSGGVPGLENKIEEDLDPWNYSLKIGDYSSDDCSYQGYSGKLHCYISLPSGYSNAIRSLSLSVNGCDRPIHNEETAALPAIEKASGGGGGGTSNEGACGPMPDVCTDPSGYSAWSSCMAANGGSSGSGGVETVTICP